MASICQSIGIEIEFSSVPMGAIKKVPKGWSLDRDGSVTRNAYLIKGMPVEINGSTILAKHLRNTQIGGELISPILSFETGSQTIADQTAEACEMLKKMDERPSDLSSIHVHVFMGKYPPIKVIKRFIALCKHLEAGMYRIGVGDSSSIHRGITHGDYTYCRPITGLGPQAVLGSNGGWYWAFDLNKLMEAQTPDDFIMGWCCAHYQPNKWQPGRYYWTHPLALFRQGTLEIRLYNESLDPRIILAWVDLTRAICSKAFFGKVDLDLPENSLGSSPEEFTVEDFINAIGVENFYWGDKTLYQLERLWFKNDWQPGVKGYMVNHLCYGQRKTLPMGEIPSYVRPDRISQEVVEPFYQNGQSGSSESRPSVRISRSLRDQPNIR